MMLRQLNLTALWVGLQRLANIRSNSVNLGFLSERKSCLVAFFFSKAFSSNTGMPCTGKKK